MAVDTRKEAVEAFIQSTLKDHVLSEGMPRTSADTQDAYAIVKLLRSFLEKVEALEAQVRAADALADAFEDFNGKIDKARAPVGSARIAAIEALAAYRATKEGGA